MFSTLGPPVLAIILMPNCSYAILIPVHNEAGDIRPTLEAALGMRAAHKEIIVVDDASTDNTPTIVAEYAERGVRLVQMSANRGVAAARNVGLHATQADIVIILNADVLLPIDLIEQLDSIYQKGADFVVVESTVANPQDLFARYVQACHDRAYKSNPVQGNYDWSEGWSCRREAALAVGGFPEELPGASGEDAIFVNRLVEQKYKRVYSAEIVVTHQVPRTLNEFWKQRLGRGRGVAYRRFGYEKVEPQLGPMLRAWLGVLIWLGTLILPMAQAIRLTTVSPLGWRDYPGLLWAVILDSLGHQLGYWRGYRQIVQSRAKTS